jgi:hypothetical protein
MQQQVLWNLGCLLQQGQHLVTSSYGHCLKGCWPPAAATAAAAAAAGLLIA